MNCYYHSDREVVGMCVSCGKPICLECKVVLKERLYCNTCVDTGKIHFSYQTVATAWWLLPVFIGIFGGIVAYIATRGKNPTLSRDYLVVGGLVTVWQLVLAAIFIIEG